MNLPVLLIGAGRSTQSSRLQCSLRNGIEHFAELSAGCAFCASGVAGVGLLGIGVHVHLGDDDLGPVCLPLQDAKRMIVSLQNISI